MNVLSNPFLLSGHHSAAYFCNREDKLAALNDHLYNERNLALYSWRRMGKTTLIKRFLKEKAALGKIEYLYVDLLGSRTVSQAVALLIKAIFKRYGENSGKSGSSFKRLSTSLGIPLDFDWMNGFASFSLRLQQQGKHQDLLEKVAAFLIEQEKTTVIAFDEFQQIANYQEENAEAIFNSFMQKYPQIRFIFSGSHRKLMRAMFAERSRPFYKSCSMMSLGPIPKERYFSFIKQHFQQAEREINDELMDYIYNWSRGQTYAIQLLCNRLFGSGREVNTSSLEELVEEILEEESPVFSNYFHLLPKMQWKVLKAIATEEKVSNPLSKDFLNKHQLGAASSVSTAIKSLEDKEMLAWEEGQYFVHDLIFSRWLEKR